MGTQLNMNLSSLRFIRWLIFILGVILFFFLEGCVKKSEQRLMHAQNYYKLCMVELSESDASDASLRRALSYIEKALELDVNPECVATQATILFRLNRYKKSLRLFEQALALTKKDSLRGEILNNLACVYAKIGKTLKAAHIWKQLVSAPYYLTPEVALINLAKLQVQAKRYDRARDYFNQAVTEAPTYIDAHFYLALIAYQMEDFGCARGEVATTLFMDPGHQGARELENLLAKKNSSSPGSHVLL